MGRFSDIARARATKAAKVADRPAWWLPAMFVIGCAFGLVLLFNLMRGPGADTGSADGQGNGGPAVVTVQPGFDQTPGTLPGGTLPPGTRQPADPGTTVSSGTTRPPDTSDTPTPTGAVTTTSVSDDAPGTTVTRDGDWVTMLGPGSQAVEVPAAAYDRAVALVAAADPDAQVTGAVATAVSPTTVTFSLTVAGSDDALRASVSVDPAGNWVGFLA